MKIWKALTIFNTLFILASFAIGFLNAMETDKREKLAHQITFDKPRVDKRTMRMLQKKKAISMNELEKICDKDKKKDIKDHLTPKERFDRMVADYAAE